MKRYQRNQNKIIKNTIQPVTSEHKKGEEQKGRGNNK